MTRDEMGNIVAIIILLNCFIFNNNAYVLFGVSAWIVIWGLATKQFTRENFKARRAIITGIFLAVTTTIAIFIMLHGAPTPLPTP